jgi:cellulose synthase (UDP-forming)
VRVCFVPLNLAQQRQLVEMLYCRPGQWRSRCAPGELHSIWLLFKVLLQPQVLFNRAGHIRPLAVAKG